MRLLRVALCGLALTAWAAAQVSSSSSAPSSGGPSAQEPQAQQNPLQEPVQPTQTEAGKPKGATFDVGATAGTARDQTLGEIRLMTRHTELGGDITRSFKVDGYNQLAEVNYFMDRGAGGRRVQFLTMFRGTDDRSIDPEHNSLQKTYLRIYGPREEYIIGDSLVSFSRLTFNQNIKGLSTAVRVSDGWKISSAAGVFVDRWGSLYRADEKLPGKPYTSGVGGVRVEHNFRRDSSLGFNVSASGDRISSLPLTSAGTAPLPSKNLVSSIDTKLQARRVRLEAELAYSVSDFDKRLDCTEVTGFTCPDSRLPDPALGNQGDWGARVDAVYRSGRVNLRGSYARFQPTFASMSSRQIADLQDWVTRAGVDITDWMLVEGTLRRSNNNLKKQLPFETVLWGPEARVMFHNLPGYRGMQLSFGYRHRDVEASDASIDRYVRLPFAEVTLPMRSTFFSVGYERRQAIDRVEPGRTSNTDRVYGSLRGMYSAGGWLVNPVLRYEFERQSHRPRLTSTTTSADCVLDPALCRLERDNNRLASAMLFIEAPRWFIVEGAYRGSSATVSALCNVTISPTTPRGCPLGPIADPVLVPGGYRRPSYRAAVTYKIANDENKLFIFSFERNNHFFFTSPDYDERQIAATLVIKFGNRMQ